MTTINQEEIQKFSKLAEEWWDVSGKFKPLHMFNPIRIEYILEKTLNHFNRKNKGLPLKGLKFLDIGCGGGLMSEPMSRLGADVTGIDASLKNIKIAETHSKKNNLKINYLNTSPENFNENDKFDVILNLEIVEHVEDVDLYFASCAKLLKKKWINVYCNFESNIYFYIKAIIGAEYILKWLPIGTHDWNKFFKPKEIEDKISKLNFSILEVKGLEFNPFTQKWKRSNNLSVNYIIASVKN